MNGSRLFFVSLVIVSLYALEGCGKTEDLIDFTEEDEMLLGDKLAEFIESSEDFELVPQESNPLPYQYAGDLLQNLTNTDLITKSESYTWKVRILDNETRQAFVLPGGYLYISTGLIFFFDNEDQFTGLLAHLISHANFSHTVETLVYRFGINDLKSAAASGGADRLKAITEHLDLRESFLTYSSASERQADSLSVKLLGRIDQSCEGTALAAEKIFNVQPNRQAGLISAHMINTDRIVAIEAIAASEGCDTTVDDTSNSRYTAFRNSLP